MISCAKNRADLDDLYSDWLKVKVPVNKYLNF